MLSPMIPVVTFATLLDSVIRHYLVIPVDHIPTVKELQSRDEDYSLVSHMLGVEQTILHKEAPQVE
ncbi:hypothetical protein SLEP1_g8897 [Rubroshorea leprosula]|uniref:Uncharacterized protein n=1 Tax=Rubroshorea leprosula TaxID=152421 RepID=A0AAV5ICG2_9ROSI|nr:hypothetical protein SLEP1_g8897 [Rubroshorea leprosula]